MTIDSLHLVVALIAACSCALLVGCRPNAAQRPLTVVISGDTAGWIVPCGCTSNQSGGLLRRASCVNALRDQADVLLADVGGAPHGNSPYDLAKFEAILRGEQLMGVIAHNIGATEAQLDPTELRRLAAVTSATLLSANARDRSGQPIAAPLKILPAAGRRVAFIGVLSERYATEQIKVSPPRQAVLDALRSVAKQYDTVIVLAYLPEDELRNLAESLPEADVVVGGPTGQPIAPELLGPTLLTSATSKGKFVVQLDAPPPGSPSRWTGRVVELNEQFADEPRQTANLEQLRATLAASDFTPRETGFADLLPTTLPKGFAIAGTSACCTCHEDDCNQWRKSTHANAWNSLKTKGAHVDPECQRCHTTGYGLPGGFVSVQRSEATVDVGCESCHGPSQSHVVDTAVRTTHFAQARSRCIGCHDRENSPTFAYDAYWPKIQHGQKATGNDQ